MFGSVWNPASIEAEAAYRLERSRRGRRPVRRRERTERGDLVQPRRARRIRPTVTA